LLESPNGLATGAAALSGAAIIGGIPTFFSDRIRAVSFALRLNKSRRWNIHAVHFVQSGPHVWKTHWATFVLRVGVI
jgi:hypothetical protein